MAKTLPKPADSSTKLEGRKQFQRLDIPEGKKRCYYDVKLLGVTEIDTDKFNAYAVEFEIVGTDTDLEVGSTASIILNPFQDYAAHYFYKDVFGLYIALSQKKPTEKRVANLKAAYKETWEALRDDGFGVGEIVRYKLNRRPNARDASKTVTDTEWCLVDVDE